MRPPSMEKGPSQRCLRVGEEIRRLLVSILRSYFFEDPSITGQSITITEVQMSPDLAHARVFFLPLGGTSKDAILKILQKEQKKIRHVLSQKVRLRIVPVLDFRIDETFDTFAALTQSLKTVL